VQHTSGSDTSLPPPRVPQYSTSGATASAPASDEVVDNAPTGENTVAAGGLAVDLIDNTAGGLITDSPARTQRHQPVSINLGAPTQQLPQENVAVITDGQGQPIDQPTHGNAQPHNLSPQHNQPPVVQNQPPVPQNNPPQPQPQAEESDSEEMESGPSGISPPNFKGTATENAEVWLRHFGNYCTYKGYDEARTKALFKVMLIDTAAEWFDSVPQATQNNWDNLKAAFLQRYTTPEFMKYKHAHKLFNHKQEGKSVDDYLAHMQRLARQINATDDMLRYAVLNGLRPDIKN